MLQRSLPASMHMRLYASCRIGACEHIVASPIFPRRSSVASKGKSPYLLAPLRSLDQQNENDDLEQIRQQLTRSIEIVPMSGSELRELVFNKWNRSYDVRLQRRGKRMYLHVMWKHLEQKSFHLTEDEYELQLEAVADYLNLWGVADVVRSGIANAKYAPGYMTGGNAKAYSIALGVDIGSGRSEEWNSF